jgi:hypothetical protein
MYEQGLILLPHLALGYGVAQVVKLLIPSPILYLCHLISSAVLGWCIPPLIGPETLEESSHSSDMFGKTKIK